MRTTLAQDVRAISDKLVAELAMPRQTADLETARVLGLREVIRGDVSEEVPRVDLYIERTLYLGVAVQGAGGVRRGDRAQLESWIAHRADRGDLAILTRHRADGDLLVMDLSGPVEVLAYYPAKEPTP